MAASVWEGNCRAWGCTLLLPNARVVKTGLLRDVVLEDVAQIDEHIAFHQTARGAEIKRAEFIPFRQDHEHVGARQRVG